MAERAERGSALLLFPTAIAVLLLLAAIAVDLSTVHLARRELLRTASQAADDAASMIDRGLLRRTGEARIDHAAADRVIRFELAAAHLAGTLTGPPIVAFDDAAGTVTVSVSMQVEGMFRRVVPGGERHIVTAVVSGRLLDD
jgi:uncharacterized membrane protein